MSLDENQCTTRVQRELVRNVVLEHVEEIGRFNSEVGPVANVSG